MSLVSAIRGVKVASKAAEAAKRAERVARIKKEKQARRLAQMRVDQMAERYAIGRVSTPGLQGSFKTIPPRGTAPALPARAMVGTAQKIGMSRGYDPYNSYDALERGIRTVFSQKGANKAKGQYLQPPRTVRPTESYKPSAKGVAGLAVAIEGLRRSIDKRRKKK